MEDAVSLVQFQCVDPVRQGARLAVVQLAGSVDGDQQVVIEIARVLGGQVRATAQAGGTEGAPLSRYNLPRGGAQEPLSWNGCESFNQCRRADVGGEPDLFGVEPAAVLQCHLVRSRIAL